MKRDYYEKYWRKELSTREGFANAPPERSEYETGRILNIITPYLRGRVLDAGCGDGSFANAINKLPSVTTVHGIDISKTAVSIAKSRYQLSFKIGQVTNMPFSSDYFNTITAIELVEHIEDTVAMFQEFQRVLKKGGHLIVTTTDFNLLKRLIIALFFWDKYFYPTNPHIRFFNKKSLEEMLSKFGFQKVMYKWNGSYFGIMPKGQIMVARK